jgi:N-acetylglucosamine kinase-like BadF-type ATPase
MHFYIGIDSGATNCRFLIETENGKIYECSRNSTHLPTAGTNYFTVNLSIELKSLFKKLHLNNNYCKGLCIGIAGVRNKQLRKIIKEKIIKKIKIENVIVTSDTEIARYGIYNDEDGLIFISGTGSILYGKIKNKIIQVGGWGRIIGDAGSGYQIGQLALQKITEDFDNITKNNKLSLFTVKICKAIGFKPDNLIEFIYLQNYPVATLAEYVIKLANKGNKTAQEILNKSVESAMKYFNVISSKFSNGIKLTLIGSLLENENYFSKRFKNLLKEKYPRIEIIKSKQTPVFGALKIAKKEFPDEKD